jgi:hypothetical protein
MQHSSIFYNIDGVRRATVGQSTVSSLAICLFLQLTIVLENIVNLANLELFCLLSVRHFFQNIGRPN